MKREKIAAAVIFFLHPYGESRFGAMAIIRFVGNVAYAMFLKPYGQIKLKTKN